MAAPSTIGQVRDTFPKLGELADNVLFGDVWERKGLSLSFYAGWPNGGTAAVIAKQVFHEHPA